MGGGKWLADATSAQSIQVGGRIKKPYYSIIFNDIDKPSSSAPTPRPINQYLCVVDLVNNTSYLVDPTIVQNFVFLAQFNAQIQFSSDGRDILLITNISYNIPTSAPYIGYPSVLILKDWYVNSSGFVTSDDIESVFIDLSDLSSPSGNGSFIVSMSGNRDRNNHFKLSLVVLVRHFFTPPTASLTGLFYYSDYTKSEPVVTLLPFTIDNNVQIATWQIFTSTNSTNYCYVTIKNTSESLLARTSLYKDGLVVSTSAPYDPILNDNLIMAISYNNNGPEYLAPEDISLFDAPEDAVIIYRYPIEGLQPSTFQGVQMLHLNQGYTALYTLNSVTSVGSTNFYMLDGVAKYNLSSSTDKYEIASTYITDKTELYPGAYPLTYPVSYEGIRAIYTAPTIGVR